MVVEVLEVYKVKDYSEAYNLYKQNKFGKIEQRMPENLVKVKESVLASDYELILSLLSEDKDNVYHVFFDGEFYQIHLLGFSFTKEFRTPVKAFCLTFGEDGKWDEVKHDSTDDSWDDGYYEGELNFAGEEIRIKHDYEQKES